MTIKKLDKFIIALSISLLFYGLFLLLTKMQIIVPILMISFSSILIYHFYIKKYRRISNSYSNTINVINISLGFILITVDIIFNLVVDGKFGSYDIGLIIIGLGIIFLNINIIKIPFLDQEYIDFLSKFLFIYILIYGFIFSGIQYLTGNLTENYFLTFLTILSAKTASIFLSFIGPTTTYAIFDQWSQGIAISYRGFVVNIFSPCSGAESIVIFISGIIGYIFSKNIIGIKKIVSLTIIGLIALFLINVGRIIILMLIGYYFGAELVFFFHYNLGWIFFIIGMAVFWLLIMREEDKIINAEKK